MNKQLTINDAEIKYENVTAVNKLSLTLNRGEIGCLLGPSGCGKTSLQRAIAGFESLSHGEIELAGKTVSTTKKTLNPERRNVGMVFQDYALFPHLNVKRNIAFGLTKLNNKEQQERVSSLLEMVGLSDYENAFPHELSGGQQQRIALARAIAPKPNILLLDEPFSSLDATLRETLAKEVRQLLKADNITAILVTHDQHEAFAMADKVGVMNKGKLLQWDTPYKLYHQPKDRFVANFIGEGKVIHAYLNGDGQLANGLGIINGDKRLSEEREYSVLVRPDDVIYDPNSDIKLTIVDKLFRGAEYLYHLSLPDGQHVLCMAPSHIDFNIGDTLPVKMDLQHLVFFSE